MSEEPRDGIHLDPKLGEWRAAIERALSDPDMRAAVIGMMMSNWRFMFGRTSRETFMKLDPELQYRFLLMMNIDMYLRGHNRPGSSLSGAKTFEAADELNDAVSLKRMAVVVKNMYEELVKRGEIT